MQKGRSCVSKYMNVYPYSMFLSSPSGYILKDGCPVTSKFLPPDLVICEVEAKKKRAPPITASMKAKKARQDEVIRDNTIPKFLLFTASFPAPQPSCFIDLYNTASLPQPPQPPQPQEKSTIYDERSATLEWANTLKANIHKKVPSSRPVINPAFNAQDLDHLLLSLRPLSPKDLRSMRHIISKMTHDSPSSWNETRQQSHKELLSTARNKKAENLQTINDLIKLRIWLESPDWLLNNSTIQQLNEEEKQSVASAIPPIRWTWKDPLPTDVEASSLEALCFMLMLCTGGVTDGVVVEHFTRLFQFIEYHMSFGCAKGEQ